MATMSNTMLSLWWILVWSMSAVAAATANSFSVSSSANNIVNMQDNNQCAQGMLTTAEQRAAFERDGYVVIRGLLNQTTVEELVAAGHKAAEEGLIQQRERAKMEGHKPTAEYRNFQATRVALTPSIFQDVAIFSDLPKVVAELMHLDAETQTLRLIHDFFMGRDYTDPKVICDWHVDGHGLWPESYKTPSVASQQSGHDQDGINAWVALDDMPAEYQGSMAVSAGSHKVPWRYEAYKAIGRDGTVNGGETWEELVDRMAGDSNMVEHPEHGPRIRLCSLGVTAPDLYDKLEAQKRVLDLQAGDVVFCSRHLFHRTLRVTEKGKEYYPEILNGRTNLNRYTIRYTAGSAELPTGYCWMEWSMVTNPEIAGWTLDQVSDKNNGKLPYWFPKVWPSRPNDIQQRLQDLVPHVAKAKEALGTVQAKLMKEVQEAKNNKKQAVEGAESSSE